MKAPIVVVIATLCAGFAGAALAQDAPSDVEDPLRAARLRVAAAIGDSRDVKATSLRLAEIAWLDDPNADPLRANAARTKLVSYGKHAVPALREVLRRADPVWSVDITAALLELRWSFTGGVPAEYRPTLVDVMWTGNTEARRLLIPWAARFRLRHGMLPAIDAALEEPDALLDPMVRFMYRYADVRGRFFLGDVLRDGSPALQEEAARQLALLGAEALEILREATLSDDPRVRELAIDALLPVSGVDDLTALYEYVARYGDTDAPERRERIVERASHLEAILAAQSDAEAASADD